MDPLQVEEDRDVVAAFYGAKPSLFDSMRRSVSIGPRLHDMERVFQMCHIEDHLQVSLVSRCFIGDSRLWWATLGEPVHEVGPSFSKDPPVIVLSSDEEDD